MRRTLLLPLLLLAAAPAAALDVLNPVDIEKVAGVAGVRPVPRDPHKGAGGDWNFAGSDGKLLIMVKLYPGSDYGALKKTYFAGDISAVGDEAFAAPPGTKEPYVLFLRKGSKAASLTTYFQKSGKPKLTMEQLSALGRVVASRL